MKPSKSIGRSVPVKTSQIATDRDDGAELSRHSTSRQALLSPAGNHTFNSSHCVYPDCLPSGRSRGLASPVPGLNGHQNRPFSPYRHAPTNEDPLHAVIRGRVAAPSEPNGHDKESSVHANGRRPSKLPSAVSTAKPATTQSRAQPKSDGDVPLHDRIPQLSSIKKNALSVKRCRKHHERPITPDPLWNQGCSIPSTMTWTCVSCYIKRMTLLFTMS
jgi:hypothetical protein